MLHLLLWMLFFGWDFDSDYTRQGPVVGPATPSSASWAVQDDGTPPPPKP